ncbi:MAG: hypothetical protein BGP06_04085 [Rhizobiales bacterium 65-9]|nr:MAG: hypothetical protein BGP06_04085 [Rhizobiales bacterium 65-9]
MPTACAICCLAMTASSASAADLAPRPVAAQAEAGLLQREQLTGDWGGARSRLEEAGVAFGLTATGDISMNPAGGLIRGRGFSGLLQFDVDFNLEKLVGWQGGALHAGAFLIGGHGLSGKFIGNLMPISNIENDPAGRLAEIYFMQTLFDGRLSFKIGQIAADGEFATSETAGLFVNSAFGWPGLHGVVLPGGGPAYPVPAPGVQVAYKPDDAWTIQAGVYSGNPLGRNDVNRHGLTFPLNQGVFAIAEAAYTHDFGAGVTGAYKLGGWYNSQSFDDLRIATNGLSFADPAADPDPRRHRGNFAVYGVIDQGLWKSPDAETTGRRLAAFARVVIAPKKDRSQVDFYADAGISYMGLLHGRNDDVVGLAVAYASVSSSLRQLDRDMIAFSGNAQPVRSSEVVFEASYQARLTPWLKVQPFAQWIVRPGGGEPDPDKPWRKIPNATVIGLRSVAVF